MTWIAYLTLFAAGLGVGLSIGVALMASLRLSAHADEEIDTMLDHGETPRTAVTYDFTRQPY